MRKKVLIIGGGDGGVAREFCLYPEIEEIDVVESDEMFMEVCRKYFPDMTRGPGGRTGEDLSRGRPAVPPESVRRCMTSSSMTPPTRSAIRKDCLPRNFYGAGFRALKEDGIMVYQHGSPFYDEDEMACRSMHRKGLQKLSDQQSLSGAYSDMPRRVTGCSGSRRRNIIQSKDFNGKKWRERKLRHYGTIRRTCTSERLCCRGTSKIYWKRRNTEYEQIINYRVRRCGACLPSANAARTAMYLQTL